MQPSNNPAKMGKITWQKQNGTFLPFQKLLKLYKLSIYLCFWKFVRQKDVFDIKSATSKPLSSFSL